MGVRENGDTPSWGELTDNLQVLRSHEFSEVVANFLNAIFMKVPMISKAKEVKLQGFRFYHFLRSNIINVNFGKIWLISFGTKRSKFSTDKSNPLLRFRVFIVESLKETWVIRHFILRV